MTRHRWKTRTWLWSRRERKTNNPKHDGGKIKTPPPPKKKRKRKTRRKELYSLLDLYRPLRISSGRAPQNHDILLYHASISHRRITQEWRKRTRRWMKESEKSISLREFQGASWVQHSGFQDLISKPVSRAMVPARARGLCCHHALARVCVRFARGGLWCTGGDASRDGRERASG